MLYNEFRPIFFDEVKGQDIAVKIIRNQADQLAANAFIFVGKHGTGKTTIAKIFARALNCENPESGNPCNECASCADFFSGTNFDIMEIDGASHNSVDDVRQIQEQLVYSPRRKKKIYIIDEVHMLSTGAFNALLKTLEEPPSYAVFILCTTEVNKIPATIRSRCITVHLQRIPKKEILDNLKDVCVIKNYQYEEEGLSLIADIANGSMRDALSMLEKCLSYGELSLANISDVLGVVDSRTITEMVKHLLNNNPVAVVDKVSALYNKGKDMLQLVSDMIKVFRNIMVLQTTDDSSLFDTDISDLKDITLHEHDCYKVINELSALLTSLKYADNQKVLVDVSLIQIANLLQGQPAFKQAEVKEKKQEEDIPYCTTQEEAENVNHHDYLVCKIPLIRSFEMDSKEVSALLNAQIYTQNDCFYIRTDRHGVLDAEDIRRRLKEISGKDLVVAVQNI